MSEATQPINLPNQFNPSIAYAEQGNEAESYQRHKYNYLSNLRTISNIERTNGNWQELIKVGAFSMHHFFECLQRAEDKWSAIEDIRSEVDPNQFNRFEGAFGEYQIYSLVEQVAQESGLRLTPTHGTVEEDLSGIDLWVQFEDDLPEFKSPDGSLNELAVAVKSVPLPIEINDIFYPARDEEELHASIESIRDSYISYSFGMPHHERNKNLERIIEAMSFAYHRLQGHEYDERYDNWIPKYASVNQTHGSHVIPTIALASNYTVVKRFRLKNSNAQIDLLPQELIDTATYQLTDNPDRWAPEPYLPDGSPNPFFPYAA